MPNPPQTSRSSPPPTRDIRPPRSSRARPTARAGRLAGRAVLLAWGISVLYHVVLFAVMYLIPWLAGLARDVTDAPTPLTDLVSPVDRVATTVSPRPQPTQSKTTSQRKALEFKPNRFQPLEGIQSIKPNDLEILGIGTTGGDLGKDGFSIPLGGAGPEFFGLGGEARGARNIVYVVDRSGSMLNTFSGVVRELKESIGALRRTQRFHVIFFNSGAPLENPPRRLVSAVRSHRRAAFRFLDQIAPMGGTDPRPAMRRAFAVEPDLIYFLTDGEFEGHAQSMFSMLDKLNRMRDVRIFTIAYVNQRGGAVLERIAREHNGEYRFVSEDEIFD